MTYANTNQDDQGRELGWGDQISNDGETFVLAPAGDYSFEVTDMERDRSKGEGRLPSCNMAVLTIKVPTPEGDAFIKHWLLLHSKLEWKLCEFFTAIGERKRGEPLKMNWGRVVGATGRCKVGIRTWTNDKGENIESNEVLKFYEPEEKTAKAFTPGTF